MQSQNTEKRNPFYCNSLLSSSYWDVIHLIIKQLCRTGVYDIPSQDIITRDSVTVSVDAVVFYRFFKTYLRENIIYFVLILQGVHASARCLWRWGLQAEMKKGFSGDKSRLRRSRSFQTWVHNKPGFLNLVLLQSFPDWV